MELYINDFTGASLTASFIVSGSSPAMALMNSPSVLLKSHSFSPLLRPGKSARLSVPSAAFADVTSLRGSSLPRFRVSAGRRGGIVYASTTTAVEESSAVVETPVVGDRKIPFSDVTVTRPTKVYTGRKWSALDIGTAAAVAGMHGLALFAPFTFNWDAFWVAVELYVATGLFGITLSYHRNLSHRSFKVVKPLEYFFAYWGVQTLQGNPIDWVSTHRIHHKYCETEKDPHSPTMGFWYSHFGWLFNNDALYEKGVKRDNVADLESQWYYRFMQKTYLLHPMALAAVLYAMGGWPYVVWGMGVRTCAVYHATWFVNSAGHVWGDRVWQTTDLSRNNWVNAVLTFGDGWHNNHHAFEFSARHGFEWWQFDLTWYFIKFLESIGLASDIKVPTESQKAAKAIKNATPA